LRKRIAALEAQLRSPGPSNQESTGAVFIQSEVTSREVVYASQPEPANQAMLPLASALDSSGADTTTRVSEVAESPNQDRRREGIFRNLRSRLGRAGAKLQLRKEQKKQLLDLGTQLEDLVREHAAQRTRSAWRPLILRTSTAPSRQTAIKPESDARTHKALKKYISATLKPQYSAALSKREARLNAKPRNPKPVEDAGSLLRRELADMGERQLIQLDDGEYDEYGPKKNKGRDQKPLGSAGLEATYWRGV
jgi:hypothetical protein